MKYRKTAAGDPRTAAPHGTWKMTSVKLIWLRIWITDSTWMRRCLRARRFAARSIGISPSKEPAIENRASSTPWTRVVILRRFSFRTKTQNSKTSLYQIKCKDINIYYTCSSISDGAAIKSSRGRGSNTVWKALASGSGAKERNGVLFSFCLRCIVDFLSGIYFVEV